MTERKEALGVVGRVMKNPFILLRQKTCKWTYEAVDFACMNKLIKKLP